LLTYARPWLLPAVPSQTATGKSASAETSTVEAASVESACVTATSSTEAVTRVSALRRRVSVTCVKAASANTRGVMRPRTPSSKVMIEVVMEVIAIAEKEWSVERKEWRIESPTERTVEDSIARNKGVGAKPRIPIPAGPIPAGTKAVSIDVSGRRIHVRFGQIRRS